MPSPSHASDAPHGSDLPSVLVVTHWDRRGGAERIVELLLERLAGDFSLTLGFARPAPDESPRLRWDGPRAGVRDLLFGRWDLIHTHLFLPGLLARVRRIWDPSTRWVHSVHYDAGYYETLRMGRLRRFLDHRWIFPGADAVAAVSEYIESSLPLRVAAVLVENALEPGPEMPGVRARPAPQAEPVIGTVAMLRREKGVGDLLAAFVEFRRTVPGARLLVAGDGPLRGQLQDRAVALDLAGAVELAGWVEDVDAFYRRLDLYVQPSLNEGFGLAALDALGHGLPVVTTDAGNLPRLLGHGRWGIVVEAANDRPGALARGMGEAWERREELAAKAREGFRHWSERTPSPEGMAAAYADVYRRVLAPAVCMIAPLATHSPGGLQRQLLLQSRELARRGWRVFLIQRQDRQLRLDPDLARQWRHVHIVETWDPFHGHEGRSRLLTRLRGTLFTVGARRRLRRWREHLAIQHAHQLHSPTLAGAWAKRAFGLPLVVKVTASGWLGEAGEVRRLPFRRLRGRAFRSVDRVLVLSEEMRTEVEALGFAPSRVRLVPNAVQIPSESAPVPSPGEPPLRVAYVGRLAEEKLLGTLLDAAERVVERHGPGAVEVHLVGGPSPSRDATPMLAGGARELDGRVEVVFHGEVADPMPHYRAAHAFVLPSRSEGMSNALLEAMAMGVPCVASDIAPNRWALDDGRAGVLFPPGDAGALADHLEMLLLDRTTGDAHVARALAAAARERALERFSVTAVVDAIEAVYAQLGASRPA